MRNKKKVGALALALASVAALGVGYAVINTVDLSINSSTANAVAQQTNFDVKFTNATLTGDATPVGNGENDSTVTIAADGLSSTFNIKGLTKEGDTATITYTITNASNDLDATLAITTVDPITGKGVTNSNTEWFDISTVINDNANALSSEDGSNTRTATVTITLNKTPISADQTATVTCKLTATPVAHS